MPSLIRRAVTTTSGIGVASAAAAGVLGAMTLSSRSEFLDSGRVDGEARDAAVTLRTATNVAIGAAVTFVVAGVVLVWTGRADAVTRAALVPRIAF